MILTYKVKHNRDFTEELKKARQIAEFAVKYKAKSSKDVKQFGLNATLSNQIVRKYSRNNKIKRVSSVKITVPNQAIKFAEAYLFVACLKLKLPFNLVVTRVNQIELDETYAYITYTIADVPVQSNADWIGVDLNATGHLAVCAINNQILKLGKEASYIHNKYKHIRKSAQKQKAFKFIKKIKNKESRKVRDLNHKISRKIVDAAYQNSLGIKLEKLTNIRKKKGSKKLNYIKSTWSFYQLQTFIEYKAKLLGVRVEYIDPAYTSQRCSICGTLGDRDKKVFKCVYCGHKDHADANASFNIAKALLMHDTSAIDRDVAER